MQTRFLFIVLLSLFIIPSCSKKKSSDSESGVTQHAANVAEVIAVTKRTDKASNFSWKDSTGKTIDLDGFKGKVTVLNFWATWCGPCKAELPDLIAISKEMADRGVRVIGVSTDRGSSVKDDVASFVAEKGIPYQIVIANDDLDDAYGNIRLIPTTFILDANGNIAQTLVGGRSKEQFMEAINALLK